MYNFKRCKPLIFYVADSSLFFAFEAHQSEQYPHIFRRFDRIPFNATSLNVGSSFREDAEKFVSPADGIYEFRLHASCYLHDDVTDQCRHTIKPSVNFEFLKIKMASTDVAETYNQGSGSVFAHCVENMTVFARTSSKNESFQLAEVPRFTGRSVYFFDGICRSRQLKYYIYRY